MIGRVCTRKLRAKLVKPPRSFIPCQGVDIELVLHEPLPERFPNG